MIGIAGRIRCSQESVWLAKIPPRDCVASAPFDKGVNLAAPSNRRRTFDKGVSTVSFPQTLDEAARPSAGPNPCATAS